MIRVMSYNIEGHAVLKRRRHLEEIGAVIRQMRPDIVGLQEVHRNTHEKRSGDQIAELAASTRMELYFGRSVEGWGGEYGNAILTRGRVLNAEVHPLPGEGEARTVLQSHVEVGDRTYTFVVTHLAAWFRFARGTRASQLQKLGQIIDSTDAPFILVGDFNASPQAREMKSFLAHERLQICGEHVESSHRLSRKRLDYIFSDRACKVRDSWVIRLGPSDHWPLVADLEWA